MSNKRDALNALQSLEHCLATLDQLHADVAAAFVASAIDSLRKQFEMDV